MSVIKGMLAAIGLILILKQLPHIAGYDANFAGDDLFDQRNGENIFPGIFYSLNYVIPVVLGIGLFSLLLQMVPPAQECIVPQQARYQEPAGTDTGIVLRDDRYFMRQFR